jgi:acetylornithine deacetylase/succinyl-diaminopimelate desuccinylase-like protein
MDNPIYHLAAAVTKVSEYLPPMRLNETTRVFFQRVAKISPPDEERLFSQLEHPTEGLKAQEALRRSTKRSLLTYNSMLRTSISANIIQGGFRSNVIPAEAEARLDVRAVPDENMAEFIVELQRIINDPQIEIVPVPTTRPKNAPSPLSNEMFQALEKAQGQVFPEALTLPMMGTGATDSAQLRSKGVHSYGVSTPRTDEDAEGVHGHNERASIEAFGKFVEFIYRAVVEVAVSQQ